MDAPLYSFTIKYKLLGSVMKSTLCLLAILCVQLVEGNVAQIPPAINLFAVKVEREEIDRCIPTFAFILQNGSCQKEYALIAENIDGQREVLHPALKPNSNGYLMTEGEPFEITMVGMGPAEGLIIHAMSLDGHEKGQFCLVPRPMESKSNGYTLTLRLLDPEKKSFILQLSGFTPQEEIHFYSNCKDVEINTKVRVDQYGQLQTTLSHNSSDNITGGEAYIRIVGKKGAIVISYPWGDLYTQKWKALRSAEDQFFTVIRS